MSVEGSYRTRIVVPKAQITARQGNIKGTPCFHILAGAIQKVLKDRGGFTSDTYLDCTSKGQKCLIAARTDDFPAGVGIKINGEGRVMFHYDGSLDKNGVAQQICHDIAHNYATIAIIYAQKALHYNVSVEEKLREGNKVTVITGVK
jgi:hypothetical protein